jgi:PAS domain S-box-containing protein
MTERSSSVEWRLFLVRIILPTILAVVLFFSAIVFLFIPAIERASLEQKKELLYELTTAAWSIIASCEHEERQGMLTQDEAQQQAIRQIGSLQYGRQMKDYFWIINMQPRMIMHPYRKDLIGRDLSNYADADGKRLFVEMTDMVKRQAAGFVQYRWQGSDDPDRIGGTKLSYVKGFAPWGWIVGTGVYTEDIRQTVSSLTYTSITVSLVILALIVALLAGSIMQTYRTDMLRRGALKALKASEERYRTIFETTGTATSIIDEDMTLALVNSIFAEFSGFSKTDIEGKKTLHDFVHPDDYDVMEGYHYARIVNPSAAPRNYEFRFIDRGGAVKNIFMTIAIIPDTKLCVASFLDMTDYKQALQQRLESEERLRSLVENSLTGIFIIQDDRIVYYNPEQERLFGPIPPDFVMTNFDKVYPEDVPRVRRFYQSILSGEAAVVDIDYRFYPMNSDKTAAVRWAYCRACTIDYLGRRALLVNMMDVTRAKELEYMIGIKDKMISLGHVAAGIAHEIRNPLSGINIFLDSIRENFQDPESAEDILSLVTQAQSAAGKIESVVKGVLDFARPSTPRFDLADINEPIRDALRLCQAMLRKSEINVETTLDPGLPPVRVDVQQIEQIMLNLITNAAEALKVSAGSRKIFIKTFSDGSDVLLQFADSGPGIPPEHCEKIFDPFYTTKKDGSGIGLSIVRRIVADHRGTITVGTSLWEGAEFIIRIPAGACT